MDQETETEFRQAQVDITREELLSKLDFIDELKSENERHLKCIGLVATKCRNVAV